MRSRFIEIERSKIHYLEGGEGKPVIILPSFWVTSWIYKQFGEELSKKYHVFIPDFGRGRSTGGQPIASLFDYVSHLNRFIDEVNIKEFCLVGISFGGMIAVEYYKKYPEKIRSLFLTSTITVPIKGNLLWGAKAYFRMFYHNLFFKNGARLDLLWIFDGIYNFFLKHPKQFLKDVGIIIEGFGQIESLREIKIPHILILTNKDEFISLETTIMMRENKKLNTEEINATHPWFLLRPKEFLAKVETFLKEN